MKNAEVSTRVMDVISLFPTPLFINRVPDISICARLVNSIAKLKTKKLGTFEFDNFYTYDDLQYNEDFYELRDLLLHDTNDILDFLKVKRQNHYISGMWANVTNPNHRHHVHIHPNSLLSGVIYIKTPENCAGTLFTDPRPGARVFEPSYEEFSIWNSGRFNFPAETGSIITWPSWMSHGVERGFTVDETEERIVIAFNVQMVGNIETLTAKLELK